VKSPAKIRLRSVALPVEHGGWGFLLEPILLGLLITLSLAGVCLGLSALGVFLINHPLNLAIRDRLRGKCYPRTILAERIAIAYGALAILGLGLAHLLAQSPFWLPLVLAIPFAGIRTAYAAANRSREILPEVCGAVSLAAVAPAMGLANGLSPTIALALWAVPIVRATVSIMYVRTRLRRDRGEEASKHAVIAAHLVGMLAVSALVAIGLLPWLAVVAMGVLLGRAAFGLSDRRRIVPARTIGFQELGYGLLTVLLVGIGYPL
jgi:hypothetical protein